MTFRGGARLSLLNATWPFATLQLDSDSLSLKVFSRHYVLKKEEVRRLEYFRGWFSVGVKIVHSSPKLDSHAVFWSFEPKRVLAEAARLGYATDDARA